MIFIVGGAIAVISFSMLGYYTVQFVNIIQQGGKHTIEPGGWINVRGNITNTQGIGIYVVTFAEFGGQASVIIMDPAGETILNKNINPPIAIEPFIADIPGLYNLRLLNPTDQVLEASIGFGDQYNMLDRKNLPPPMTLLIAVSLLVIGIALAIAGAIITILDRSQKNRMKQFGDNSDLI